MISRGKHRIASVLVVALLATLVPLSVPGAVAAEVGVTNFTTAALRSVVFVDAQTGFAAASNGAIGKTTDAGNTWQTVRAADSIYDFRGIDFWDAEEGVAVTYAGNVAHTTDGGSTWQNIDLGGALGTMDYDGPERSHGKVACSPDGDRAITAAGDPNLSDDDRIGATAMRVKRDPSTNEPSYWRDPAYETVEHYILIAPDPDPQKLGKWGEFFSIEYVDSSTVWAAGVDYFPLDAYNPAKYPLFKSTNGGVSWTPVSFGTTHVRLNDVSFGTASAGVVVGQLVGGAGRVYYTTNGGSTWTQGTLPGTTPPTLNAVHMTSATHGWAVGSRVVYRTTDGGATWTEQIPADGRYDLLHDITFAPGTTYGMAVGAAGRVVLTHDGTRWYAPDTTAPSLGAIGSSSHPVAANWYASRDIVASWSAANDGTGSGVAGYSVVLDQNATTDPATTITQTGTTYSATLPADGVWYLHVRAVDHRGNWSTTQHRAFRADTTPPVTTSDAVASYTGPATITLTPTDAHAGVAQTYWSVDGGASGTGTSVVVSDEGDWTLRFASVDNLGNRETTKSASFAVEIAPTAPVISSDTHPDPDTYGGRWFAASWTASDSSGIAGYGVVVDQSPGTVPSAVTQTASEIEQDIATSGEWYLHVRARDTRGNWGPTEHRRFLVDADYPNMGQITSTTHPLSTEWYAESDIQASWTASDTSGIAGYSVVLDQASDTIPAEAMTQAGNTFSATGAADGVWYLHVRAVDNQGDWSNTRHRAFRVDTAPPVTTSNAVASYVGQATITLTPIDTGSGVAQTDWSIDGGASGTGTSVVVSEEGDWTLRFFSVDHAGNRETTKTASFAVEVPPPAPVISSATHPVPGTAYAARLFQASWPVPDDDIQDYAVVLDASPGTIPSTGIQTGTTFSAALPSGVTRYLHVRARDTRGNWGATAHFTVKVAPFTETAVQGDNRILTAIAASKIAYPSGSSSSPSAVVIATAFNWPDALGGAALAGAANGPILLSDPASLPSAVRTEVLRLKAEGATKAYILGGEAAVSPAVLSALNGIFGSSNVERVFGGNRYTTANAVAKETVDIIKAGGTYDGTAFVATGANFPDALGASPVAAAKGWPIYLVDPRGADTTLVNAMKAAGVKKIIVLGGTGAVSSAIESDLKTRLGATSERWQGGNRYSTAIAIARKGVGLGLAWNRVAIATGENFPDALSGGVLQARAGSVMLLTPSATLDSGVRSTLAANKGAIGEVRYLGGTSAVSAAVRDAVRSALQ